MKKIVFAAAAIFGLSIFSFAASENFGVTDLGDGSYKVDPKNSITQSDMQTVNSLLKSLYGVDGTEQIYTVDMQAMKGFEEVVVHHQHFVLGQFDTHTVKYRVWTDQASTQRAQVEKLGSIIAKYAN